jgi:hypothetical protein
MKSPKEGTKCEFIVTTCEHSSKCEREWKLLTLLSWSSLGGPQIKNWLP